MGKFRRYGFIKHSNCLDVFFAIDRISFDENGTHATLHGCWMIQGVDYFWGATNRIRLNIRPEQYDKWQPHSPHRELYV